MASSERRCFFYGHEMGKVAEAGSEAGRKKELDAVKINEQARELVKQRIEEVDAIMLASQSVCLIEVNLELELTGDDINDAINLADAEVPLLFPALSAADCIKLKKTLTEKRQQFEQQLRDNDGIAVVPISYSGNGVHIGGGWVLTDARLCGSEIQAHNATFTFLASQEGSAKKRAVIFEPAERFIFTLKPKDHEVKNLFQRHPAVAFVKLGVQVEQDRAPQDFQDWELIEQKMIVDDFKIPHLDVLADLDHLDGDRNNYSIVQLVPPGVKGATPTPPSVVSSFVDPKHIKVILPELGPCIMYEIEDMRRYLPQSGGLVIHSKDGIPLLAGFIFTDFADSLKNDNDKVTKYNQILPFPRDIFFMFDHAKNFMLQRFGETLTEGTGLQYNYRAIAEATKRNLVCSLGGSYDVKFIHPALDEGFTLTACVDTLSFFAQGL